MKRGLLMLLTAAIALTCALPAHAAKRKVPHGFYGVMWNRAGTDADPITRDAQFALMAKSGVESIRTVFSWANAQPEPGGVTHHRPRQRRPVARLRRAAKRQNGALLGRD